MSESDRRSARFSDTHRLDAKSLNSKYSEDNKDRQECDLCTRKREFFLCWGNGSQCWYLFKGLHYQNEDVEVKRRARRNHVGFAPGEVHGIA